MFHESNLDSLSSDDDILKNDSKPVTIVSTFSKAGEPDSDADKPIVTLDSHGAFFTPPEFEDRTPADISSEDTPHGENVLDTGFHSSF